MFKRSLSMRIEILRSAKRSKFITGQTPLEIPGFTRKSKFLTGQTTLEFTLCFIVLIMLFLGAFMAFRWGGMSLVQRENAFEYTTGGSTPPVDFFETPAMNLQLKF